MRSFSILRTNVGLTSNVKVTVDSEYNMYLDSIESTPDLDLSRFKKFQFNKNNFYDELVPYFFKDFPSEISFEIKYSNDSSDMSNKFSDQYDDIYQMGARNISNNKNYKEEYEFFAPLYVFKQNIPKYFGIFRVDGAGLGILDKSNFRDEYLEKFKCVKIIDLSKKTNLGEWVDINFKNNRSFPTYSLEVDFRNLEFSKWVGIDYNSGGYTSKSRFMDDALEKENTLYDFEKSFFDGFKINKIIYPQIVNFNFLFDDTPATKDSLRKWSINRYCGFYFDDMDIIDSITPFVTPLLRKDVTILSGNILHSSNGDPFLRGFDDSKDMWVEYLGNFYKVERFEYVDKNALGKSPSNRFVSTEVYSDRKTFKYRIISDIEMSGGELLLNKKQFRIDSSNRIVDSSGGQYQIENFELSDVNLIEIDGKFHNLVIDDDGYITIWTDYGFRIREEYNFEYYINHPDEKYNNSIDIRITNSNSPIKFNIYRVNFTEIKDFDTNVVDSRFSRYEYEKDSDLYKSEEPKLYTTDLRSKSVPPPLNDYVYRGEVVNIPAASDYTSNLETFRIIDGNLSELWRKNPTHCRWGYQNSLSKSDYPYLLNNNEIHGDFNGVANTDNILPDRSSRNLDYFYTFNSGSSEYRHHSLHLERNNGNVQDASYRFELDKYLNQYYPNTELSNNGSYSSTYSLDYFEEIFASDVKFVDSKLVKKSKKYSYFEYGDSVIPNTTLFRGLKFKIFEVESINTNQELIEEINLSTSNIFQDYKFSILMSQNNQFVDGEEISDSVNWGYFIDNQFQTNSNVSFVTSLTATPSNIDVGDIVDIRQFPPYVNEEYQGISNVTYVGELNLGAYGFEVDKPFLISTPRNSGVFRTNYQWSYIKVWGTDVEYSQEDLVLFDDILYEVVNTNSIQDPSDNPSISSDYSIYTLESPFWNPGITYSTNDWVYRNGEYYVRNSETYSKSGDFWRMSSTYSVGDRVIYNNKFFEKKTVSESRPIANSRNSDISASDVGWVEDTKFNTVVSSTSDVSIWDLVEVWNQNIEYLVGDFVVYNDVLYKCVIDSFGQSTTPGISNSWDKIYSFVPNSDFVYGTQSNPFIKMNDNTYMCSFNKNYTLDSGITVYINKKWKNILVNIFINDSTTTNIFGVPRDELYSELNSRLTAANFIKQINNLDSKYDFSEYTNYVVVEEDGTFKEYKFGENIKDLPYLLICEPPDKLDLKNDTIEYSSVNIDKNILKPNRYLVDGNIDTIKKVNYYNDIPVGYEIKKIEDSKINEVNYGRLIGNTKPINRHSGPYMPVFYTIDLFELNLDLDNPRYKFDVGLTFFGTLRQRIISKINRKGSVLKLINDKSHKSIYPMMDEFGYTFIDFFIFKSTWDYEYHVECKKSDLSINPVDRSVQLQSSQNNIEL